MNVSPIRMLEGSEAVMVRRAFSGDRRRDGNDAASVEAVDGRIVARRGQDEREVATADAQGIPGRPTISDDGTRVAFVRTSADGHQHVEIVTTASDDWRSPVCTQELSASAPIEAVDLAPDGQEIAFVTRTGEVHVSPTMGSRGGRNHFEPLTSSLGLPMGASDVEFLPSGRLAVETSLGTYLLLDLASPPSPLPMESFDREGWVARCRDMETRLAALTPDEHDRVVAEFGTGALAAHPSPDGRAVLIQVQRDGDQVENLVMERKSGRRASMGTSPFEAPSWSDNGREVWLPHGPSAPMSRLFDSWADDLGQEDLARRQAESPGVVQGSDAVWIDGVRLPRRSTSPS